MIGRALTAAAAGLCAAVPLALALGAAAPARAQGDSIRLNFEQAALRSVIDTMSQLTGRSFIIDPRVEGEVTIVGEEPMSAEAAYEVFLDVLEVHGYAAVESDDATRIVPASRAREMGTEVAEGADETGQGFVTRVLRLEHVAAGEQLISLLRGFIPSAAILSAHPPSNSLIVSDNARNVERIKGILERVDRPMTREVEVIALEHARASNVVETLKAMEIGAGSGGPAGQRLGADRRTNSVLIGGSEPTRIEMRAVIAQLDQPRGGDGDGAGSRVLRLDYGDAERVAEILGKMATNDERFANAQVQAEPTDNAIILSGSPKAVEHLADTARQLDVRRAQVMVEAVIVEISAERLQELGLQLGGLAGSSPENGVAAISQANDATTAGSLAQVLGALQQGAPPPVGGGGTLAGRASGNGLSFAGLVRALNQDTEAEILSTPSIVTVDNEEAEIVVADNVPFVTGQFSTTEGGTAEDPFQTIERRDVGLTLRVTPQITRQSDVRLAIEQEASRLTPTTAAAGGEITNRREIDTQVLVDDGSFVALGGLMSEETDERQQAIPGLGELPVLGRLFTYTREQDETRTLMVFIRPQIMREESGATAASRRKFAEVARASRDGKQWPSVRRRLGQPLVEQAGELMTLPPPFEATRSGGERPEDAQILPPAASP